MPGIEGVIERVRGYEFRRVDVFHVASALVLRADTFYTFDINQGKLAKAEGLAVP